MTFHERNPQVVRSCLEGILALLVDRGHNMEYLFDSCGFTAALHMVFHEFGRQSCMHTRSGGASVMRECFRLLTVILDGECET